MLKPILYSFLIALSFTACKSDKASEPEGTDAETPTAPATAPAEFEEQPDEATSGIRYTWVDQLNVRDLPSTKGKVVARVKPNEPLTLTGETSPKPETIVLRGVAYYEPWFRVTTADKKDGWVFGGAVKRTDESKGTPVTKAKEVSFPAFGYYDLTDWSEDPKSMVEEGDAETTTQTFVSPEKLVLRIVSVNMGDYGYSHEYSLGDADGNLFKKRTFTFAADLGDMVMTEEVEDYTDIPAKRYIRSQEVDKHFMQLNALPQMASGEWRTERIDR
jgi:hypothetical protein